MSTLLLTAGAIPLSLLLFVTEQELMYWALGDRLTNGSALLVQV